MAKSSRIRTFYEGLPPLAHIGHQGQIDDVRTAIETGGTPLVTGMSGRMTIELITAIYKAGFRQAAVELPIAKDDPCYSAGGIAAEAPRFYEKTASLQNLGSGQEISVGGLYGERN